MATRRARESIAVSLARFAWERPLIATLRHGTLPWADAFAAESEIAAIPLANAADLGTRDRLSLLGQFAAHEALLQFAGIADADFDADEWAVVPKRGADVRLLRTAARPPDPAVAPPALTLLQQFADAVRVPELDVLRQTWGRAETVFIEVWRRLRGDVAADLRWLRRAGAGMVLAPGPDALRELWTGAPRLVSGDGMALVSMHVLDDSRRVVTFGGGSILQRYSAIGMPESLSEGEAVERLAREMEHTFFVVGDLTTFDAASRRVVENLAAMSGGIVTLASARPFLIAPSLSARRRFEERNRSADDVDLDAWLERGELPVAASVDLAEPRRSYLAALALLGTRIPRAAAGAFLQEFLFTQPMEELAVDGVVSVNHEVVFVSDDVRDAVARLVPPSSRASLCRVASKSAEPLRAAELLLEAGDVAQAAALLEQLPIDLDVMSRFPRAALTPTLARAYADALIDAGRYRDARDVCTNDPHANVQLANVERRMGEYASALARLEPGDDDLLRGELLYLHGRYEEAAEAFENAKECEQLAYHKAVLANEIGEEAEHEGDTYLAARFATYRAISRGEDALPHALASMARAKTITEKIDAALDRLFVLFTAGRWDETRAAAMESLALVEETQGDRAAGGVLFTLAYLAADDAQWTQAAHHLDRLRRFYADTRDDRRALELELLAAHLDFSRGRFDRARASATLVLKAHLASQIMEAAALIVDEIDHIEQIDAPLRSTGKTGNRELNDRHHFLAGRVDEIHGAFAKELALWNDGPPPSTSTRSEALKLFRAALAIHRHDIAQQIARELDLLFDPRTTAAPPDVQVLRTAASREFPYAAHDFGDLRWRFAGRNRLGHWSEIGSLPPLAARELDDATHGEDWIECSEREHLYIDGLSRWPPESAEAIAALFRARAELHRLRRVVDQEESASTRVTSVDGIVGDSAAMRDVYALVARIAKRDVAACVLGESGTGKELVARAIHRNSARRHKTFTAVNCAALPENLIESELFGHVRGAFTGADRDRAGLIETSDGGTLFLDEIGEMPLTAQAKLLRFLQEGEFRRVGDTVNRTADVRIVSATNRRLDAAVEDGRFREDLYYRVRGVEIVLPPLRERAADIPLLAAHFLGIERDKHRGGPSRLSPDAEAVFSAYAWPGNVRELQNTIRAAHAVAGEAKEIDVEHLPERMRATIPARAAAGSYQDAVSRFRRDLIEKSLAQAMGNQNQAAAMLKISRQALAYQIRELGIMVEKPRKRPM